MCYYSERVSSKNIGMDTICLTITLFIILYNYTLIFQNSVNVWDERNRSIVSTIKFITINFLYWQELSWHVLTLRGKFIPFWIGINSLYLQVGLIEHLTELPYLKIYWSNINVSHCFSSGLTGSPKKSEKKGTELGRYLWKSCLDCDIADAKSLTDVKCDFNALDVLTGSVEIFLLSGSLIEEIHQLH